MPDGGSVAIDFEPLEFGQVTRSAFLRFAAFGIWTLDSFALQY